MEPNFHIGHSWPVSTLPGDQISHNRHEALLLLSEVTSCMNVFMLVVLGLLVHSWYAILAAFDHYHSLSTSSSPLK